MGDALDGFHLDADKKQPLYFGIDVSGHVDKLMQQVAECLEQNPQLIQKSGELHTTVVYLGGKPNQKKLNYFLQKYKDRDGQPFTVEISGYGVSQDAIAFIVSKLTFADGSEVFTEPGKTLHITFALKEGVQPKDSVLAIKNGTNVIFAKPITIDGNFKFFY